jgi:hypothetical protein
MVSLLDVAPVKKSVRTPTGDSEIEVYGVSAHGIAALFQRFPEIRMLISGQEVSTDKLIELAPDAVAAIIAAATGTPGNKDAEAIAARLPLETQIDIIDAALELTMPQGVGPFVVRLEKMGALLGAGAATVQVMKEPPLSS